MHFQKNNGCRGGEGVMQGIYSGVESNNYFHDGNTEIKIDDSNFILPFSTYVRHIRI